MAKKRANHRAHRSNDLTRDFSFREVYFDRTAGTWCFRARCLLTGKLIKKTCVGCTTRTEAAAFRKAVIADQILRESRGEEPVLVSGTIDAAFAGWLANIEADIRRPTFLDYCSQLRLVHEHFRAAGLNNVADIQLAHVEALFRTAGKNWTGRTKVKYLALLKRVFTWCRAHRLIKANPAAEMRPAKAWSKAVAQSRFRGVALTEDQARALLHACREPYSIRASCADGNRKGRQWVQKAAPPAYLFPAILFALRTGCRLRNVTGLRWKHLVNDITELRIEAAEMKSDELFHVPLHPEATARLQQLLQAHRTRYDRAPGGEDLVFGPKAAFLAHPFARALKRAGLEEVDGRRVRFHDLRHTFASWCERHCTFAAVQRLLGHSPRSVTDRYVHINMDELRDEVEKMPWLEPAATADLERKARRRTVR